MQPGFRRSPGPVIHHAVKAVQRCREGVVELGKRAFNESFFISFTKFEIRMHELERAKILYEYALANLPKEFTKGLNE